MKLQWKYSERADLKGFHRGSAGQTSLLNPQQQMMEDLWIKAHIWSNLLCLGWILKPEQLCQTASENFIPLYALWSGLWSQPQSFPRCLLWRWQRGRRTSCWRWCLDTMSLGTCIQTPNRQTAVSNLNLKDFSRFISFLSCCRNLENRERGTSYSIGNQSLQSCLTFSMSSWQRKRSWTSLRAVGGATSLIHTCSGRETRTDQHLMIRSDKEPRFKFNKKKKTQLFSSKSMRFVSVIEQIR